MLLVFTFTLIASLKYVTMYVIVYKHTRGNRRGHWNESLTDYLK